MILLLGSAWGDRGEWLRPVLVPLSLRPYRLGLDFSGKERLRKLIACGLPQRAEPRLRPQAPFGRATETFGSGDRLVLLAARLSVPFHLHRLRLCDLAGRKSVRCCQICLVKLCCLFFALVLYFDIIQQPPSIDPGLSLDLALQHFKDFQKKAQESGDSVFPGKLRTLCQLEWPTLGVDWPGWAPLLSCFHCGPNGDRRTPRAPRPYILYCGLGPPP